MIDAPTRLVELVRARRRANRPVVMGIAGAVASGKSTLAESVASAAGTAAHVVSTDGFLLPNAVLTERGLLMSKGFPESYDVDALEAFVDAVHEGVGEVMVPQYSHETYDVAAPRVLRVEPEAVVIVEGVNTIGSLVGRLDLAVYLHAEEDDLERWYLERFHELCAAARDDERSFYRRFAAMPREQIDELARYTWREVNLVNLREHIAPSRILADCVVVKGSDHRIVDLQVRDDGAPAREGS